MSTWNELRFPAREDRIWELYHENSKTAHWFLSRSSPLVTETLETLHVSLPVHACWERGLTNNNPLELSATRTGNAANDQDRGASDLTFDQLSTILRFATNAGMQKTSGQHTFWPLEVFGFISGVDWMPSGVFHVDRKNMEIRLIQESSDHFRYSEYLPDAINAHLMIFITAIFQRSALVFGEKGYRVAISESGRMAQNILMAGQALGLSTSLETRYCERKIEELIGIDGVDHALLQVITL